MTRFAREREGAVAAAREAGAAILRHYRGAVHAREKGHDSPVTAADLEADAIIRGRIAAAFPDDGWLSEETADSTARLGKPRVWIVDPLDGTKEFIQHIPEFCVCIALVEHGRPVVAVAYNPAAERLYVARQDADTTATRTLLVEEAGGRVTDLDGAPLVFNQPSPLRPGLVASNGVLHEALLALIAEVRGRG